MVDEVDCNEATPNWVRQGTPREELRNWKYVEIPDLFPIKSNLLVFAKPYALPKV